MLRLGSMYENGQGVAKDMAQAVAWYCKIAEGGDAREMNNLGRLYRDGRGVAQDDAKAAAWRGKAAALGNKSAQLWVGQ